jgi:hypothetical protein
LAPAAFNASAPTFSVSVLITRSREMSHGEVSPGV